MEAEGPKSLLSLEPLIPCRPIIRVAKLASSERPAPGNAKRQQYPETISQRASEDRGIDAGQAAIPMENSVFDSEKVCPKCNIPFM
jgi:hypothetical protein